MNAHTKNAHTKTEPGWGALATDVGDKEGGAPASDSIDCHYGRRIEGDRSWTVYHVFTGAPARIDGRSMMGLSREDATASMLAINGANVVRRKERGKPPAPTSIGEGPS